ncbi:MAG: response regulator transcription factor [Roseiflexus sp.]|nr:response regulator transcription factor [Roseiflexus sp.]MCS7289233.1 response regulator transcription factor [Roseiflexus sp.]MDW8146705.1 response regulator transcription factor [Roseiflexaceae bacterium]MDW8232646.1 response regulator transcription factor [Roseiflexaceae bacterium]
MSANPAVKLLIVDDHPLFRQGVRAALSTYRDIVVVGEASSGEEALEWMNAAPPNQEPNAVVVDLNLPGMSGLELTRQLRLNYPGVGIVVLSVYESDEQAFNALRAGASAYRSKDVHPDELADVLRRVARGEYVINDVVLDDPKVAGRVLSQFRNLPHDVTTLQGAEFPLFTPLSDREIEVLERIAAGGSNREIAEALHISTQTVKNHISSILRKLSLNDRTQAVLYALRRGWIEAPGTTRSEPSASNAREDKNA